MPPELPTQMPSFEAPQPTRTQQLSMRAAGLLLGKGRGAHPEDVMEAVVTQIGGFTEHTNPLSLPIISALGETTNNGGKKFTHPDAHEVPVAAAQDETTRSPYKMGFKNSSDFDDNRGTTDLSSAVSRTVGESRNSGPMAHTLRGRVARILVGHAVSGVGTQAHKR